MIKSCLCRVADKQITPLFGRKVNSGTLGRQSASVKTVRTYGAEFGGPTFNG